MITPGYSIYGSGEKADYNIVTTGRVIPAHSYPSSDTHTVTYALVVSTAGPYYTIEHLADMIMCGNATRDDDVDITDVVWLVGWVLNRGRPDPWIYMSDVDGSGVVDIADIVYYINYLFKSGPRPQCDCLR